MMRDQWHDPDDWGATCFAWCMVLGLIIMVFAVIGAYTVLHDLLVVTAR